MHLLCLDEIIFALEDLVLADGLVLALAPALVLRLGALQFLLHQGKVHVHVPCIVSITCEALCVDAPDLLPVRSLAWHSLSILGPCL